jgi:hypothetical protein
MLDCLIMVSSILVITVVAIILLAYRDHARARLEQKSRPIQDRIQEIQDHARFMIRQLTDAFETHRERPQQELEWIPVLITYYQRLEALAADPNASSENASRFAVETSQYVKQHRLKGVFIGGLAHSLSDLLRAKARKQDRPIS